MQSDRLSSSLTPCRRGAGRTIQRNRRLHRDALKIENDTGQPAPSELCGHWASKVLTCYCFRPWEICGA